MSSSMATPRDTSPEPNPFAPLRELPPLPVAWRSLSSAFVHAARAHSSKTAMTDSTGATLTYGDTFLRPWSWGVSCRGPGDRRAMSG